MVTYIVYPVQAIAVFSLCAAIIALAANTL